MSSRSHRRSWRRRCWRRRWRCCGAPPRGTDLSGPGAGRVLLSRGDRRSSARLVSPRPRRRWRPRLYGNGMGTLEDNDITANSLAGAMITTGGNPTLRGNRIHDNAYEAVRIHENGRGVIENNDLTRNKRGPWDIADECKANVTRAGNKE
ncbi:right-handed parallel beta-helix repeat-containing protein [Saccharopolyspora shandongensis]|uniref:right-handed parallel beta-helix repeat-containing protein n=1 Tax=Saccharopolyspora shandongensis TaxID=418495 RepID=UPI00341D5F9C